MTPAIRPPVLRSALAGLLLLTSLPAVLLSTRAGRATGTSCPPSDAPQDVQRLLARAQATYDSLTTLRARFHQTLAMRVFDPPRRREGHGTWYQKKPGRFRMDFEEPEGDLIVADGEHLWLYYPSTHPGQVVRARLEGTGAGARGAEMVDLQGRIFRDARTRFRPEYAGREEVSGTCAHVVVLHPGEGSPYTRVTAWIDARSHLLRRLRFVNRSETVRTVTLTGLEPDVPVSDTLFRFEPPAGTEVFEG